MSEESRHHHYIPQAYLKGFAHQQSKKNWQTHVTDLHQYRTYPTNVRNVCGERDFMRVDIEGYQRCFNKKRNCTICASAAWTNAKNYKNAY